MATNIEQIFRSFVVTKFREIQEQQYSGGKVGSQQNGEINSSEQTSPSDDVIASIGNLQNDPLVQKIEQVLSEVLGAETQYKPDDGEETAKSKSRCTKRSLSDEVQVEIPRKKSKKDKKHKDKKKKKKRKKEKKYKKQSKESKLNDEHKVSGDIQPVPDSKPENSNSLLSSEDVDIGSTSPLKQASEWFMEKNLYENLNSTMSNSRDAFGSDTSKLDTSEEDSALINIQELSEVDLTNEKELENDQHTNLAVHPCIEDESLNIADAESGVAYMDRDGVASIKEIKHPETSSELKAEEKVTAPENSPESKGLELDDLGTSLQPDTVEVTDLDDVTKSSHPETLQQSVPISVDKTGYTFIKPPLETVVEAKDSVTTLGFLAMVVGKDFEATSEFLNTAKVKASERSPKHDAFIDMTDPEMQDSERTVIIKDLEKNSQIDARAENKLLEDTSESLHVVDENDFEPAVGHKLKHQPKVLKGITESNACKHMEVTLDAEADVRELKETQASAIMMELKDSGKHSDPLETAADAKGSEKTVELVIMNMMDSGVSLSDPIAEVKNLEATSVLEEMDTQCVKAKSDCVPEPENWQTIPDSLRMVDVRNLDSSLEHEGEVQETLLENVVEERGDHEIAKDSETVAKLEASESFLRSGTTAEINDIKAIPETPDILKTQYLEVSKYVGETDIEGEPVNLELENIPESLLIESQYVKETKDVDDVLQSDAVAQRKDSETGLVLEGERDLDATSDSLHMIFTNYSEHSLELYAEPEGMMELKTSESIPELFPIVDADKSEELHIKEIRDIKSVESEAMVKLNDLEKKLKSLHRDVKSLEMPTVKCFKTLVTSEAMAERKNNETVSYSVTGIEKTSGTIEYTEKDQNDAESAGFKILPGCQEMTEIEPSAKTEGLLLISKSLKDKDVVSSETTPELRSIAAIQELKETVGFTAVLDISSPKETFVLETSSPVDSQEASTSVNVAKDFESVLECHAEQSPESLQTVKTKGTDVVLDPLYDLEVKYPGTSTEFLFSDESSNLETKQKLKERTETAGSAAAPESLYASQRDLIIVPVSDEANKVVNSEHCPESSYMAKTNSENVLKSLYMIQVKDSKSPLGSEFIDIKDIEMDSESTLREGVEIVGDLPECESVVAPEILEITSESPKKIEMPLESQCTSTLQISDAALRSEALPYTNLEANSETICVINIENLEVSPQCEELEVVKTSDVIPTSLFAVEVIDAVATPSSVHAIEDKESKVIKTVVKNLNTSIDSMDMLEETFAPSCLTDVKDLETSQKSERNLDYLIKEQKNNTYTESAHEVDASCSQTFESCIPVVDTHISEVLLTAVDSVDKTNFGTDLKENTQSVVKYSESVCQLDNVSERQDCDTTLSVVLVEIKDSGSSSSMLDTGELKDLKSTQQLETISESPCEFKSRDLADTVEALSAVEPKALGRTVNYSTVLEVQDPVATGTHLTTLELKSSESVSVLEVTDSEGVLELKTAPAYLGTAEDLQSSGAATETESSEINSETHLKSETTLEVKYFESASGTEYVLETFRYSAASESEGGLEKVSETATERENVEDLETVAKSKHAQEIKGMESSPQSLSNVEARDLEESIMFEEVLDVSETTSQFSSTAEVKDLVAVIPSAVAEAVKDSEKQLKLQLHVEEKCSETLECTQISDIMGTYEDGEPSCSIRCPEPTADMKYIVDSNNSEANSGFMVTVDLKDTEAFLKSTYALESVHSKEAKDFEATPKCGSVREVNVLQVAEMSAGKEGLDLEGTSKSTVALERHSSERNLPSVIISEEKAPVSLESSHAVKAKDFEAALEYKNGKDVEVLEQNSKCIHMAEMKNLESTPEHVILTQVKTSEMIPQINLEVKDSEAVLEPLCVVEEKDLAGTPQVSLEEQALKATLKPVCAGAEDNLEANQQITTELKDSEATVEPVCMVEKMNLEVGQLATVEVKGLEASLESVHTAKEKDLEATTQVSLKDQDLQAALQSSDINKQNEGSILKDKKSEKISSKSKDKSKSGKKAKKSRSKSPSKSKKRKKKSRSRSTPRKITSRRGRSRSRNDSDSRKKHSTSRHKSRSKSVDKKDSKESSLRSRRRRSRTSDHPKSRSKSVEKTRSRWRRSRSSDHRKSRSRSIEKRESARRKRRLSRSSDRYKSRSKSVDRRETLTRSRRRRSRSSDHRRSRSQSVDKRETSVRTRRRRSRSSDIHKSRSRSVDKRDTSARRRRRRSRTSDNCKSRSKSLDRRESSIRSRRRWSRSSDHRKSRSRSVDDKRDTSLRTRRKWSRSLDNRKSRSRSVDKETSIRTRRRRSRSSDNLRSRSKSVDKREISLRTRRKRSRSLENRKSRSKSVDKRESSARARRRRSRSSDNRKSRSRSADKRDASVRTRRKRSRSSDNRKSRSRSLDKGDTSVRTRRRRSRSSGDLKSRSRSVDKRETSVRTRRRRSRSSDNRRSKSKSVDKRETSVKTRRRRSRSFDCKSRSKSPDKRETSVRAKRRRSHSSDNHKSRSKSPDKIETLRSKRKRSRSCDSHKSRSKSVDKTETLIRSKRRRSESSDNKSKTKADEKESSVISRHRRSKSSDRKRSKSKSRSKSSERRKDKDASDCLREKRSKSRSDSPEKTEGTESLEASVCNRTKSPERHKSKSRSKSLDKTRERESSRRSRSKGSKSPEPKSHRHRTVSRSRRNRSRSLTRKRTSRSKSDHRSRTRSRTRSRSCSRRRRRTRSRSVSRQRSLSRDRRRRSRRNRSRSTERRRRRSDSRDSYRVSLRLRSRSRTPARLRCSRSTGRRRSASKSPDHRRSRSSSRSPKRLTDLDKAQLLEIAKANAAAMCAKAGVPLPPSLMPVLAPEKKEEKVIQKSAKETIMELTEKCKKIAQSQEDDVIVNKPHVSDEEEEEHPFINHPFKLNEPKPIFFNLSTPSIKPTPPKNQVTLTKEFPVSSGSQHRKKEADSAYGEWVPVEKNKDENKDDVFPNPANLEPVDISSALNERTIAQKRLTENTFDLEAMCLLNRAQERIDAWAQLNSMPGQFTGSTGAQVLTSEQLSNSGPQAWIKKDQFLRAAPVSGGMGAQLMRKMGWREGEGLGKNKEGNKEPILVDFKTDRKGLVAVGEKTQKRHGLFSAVKDLSGKHPVSALVEACNKRRWSPPVFVLVNDNGPEHRKHFLFKVMVNGVEHKPSNASPNKKHAKAAAATVALQALGIVPKELLANATSFRSASQN